MSLTAHHLEANGIPTVIVGSARDIVEYCRVPRFMFVDFPLGNPMGVPYDRQMQLEIARLSVKLLDELQEHGTTIRAPFEWPGNPEWRGVYNRVTEGDRERLAALGESRRTFRSSLPKREF
ncbi:MAG: hypothetical protein VW620_02495 [Rhodospirillales bacterium]